MGLFGSKEKKAAESAALQSEHDRVAAMPLKIEDYLRESLQLLQTNGLLVSTGGDTSAAQYRKTRAGQDALDAGDVAQRVGG